jgi:hypothetical protein
MHWSKAFIFSCVVGLGCATGEPNGTPNTALVVTDAPPEPKSDSSKAPPGAGYFWVKGHWAWSQEHWAWVGGYWEKQRPGYTWIEPHYEMRGSQQVYVVGGWVTENGTEPVGNTGATKGAKTP